MLDEFTCGHKMKEACNDENVRVMMMKEACNVRVNKMEGCDDECTCGHKMN